MNRTRDRRVHRSAAGRLLAACALICGGLSCGDALNPAFLSVVGGVPGGPSSRGHVAVAFRNDTFFDERIQQQLLDAGLEPALLEGFALRPRVRMNLLITFGNGEQLAVEFNDGSATVVDPAVDVTTIPELTRTEQDNLIVQCDVLRVELVGLPSVFVPVFFETTRIDPGDENTPPFRVRVNVTPPQFVLLRPDDVDQQGNTTLQRNIGIRDLPAPAVQPNCGSVVTIILSGTLTAPFEENAFGALVPGFLTTDITAFAQFPGRFQVTVGIR